MIALGACLLSSGAFALDATDVIGTWKLVSSKRRVIATGQEDDTYGAHPSGWITYGRDGRMTVLIVSDGRPKPKSIADMTDPERSELFKTMVAYSGTYRISSTTMVHAIDTSWNEVWSGTKVVRDVQKAGDRLIFTTRPAPAASDGKMSVITIVWEKVK